MPSLFSPSNFSTPGNGFCSARGGATGCSAGGTGEGGGTAGTDSCGCERRPLTIWLDSKSFFPSIAGRSLLPSGVATGCATCWFCAAKLLVLSGVFSGASGLVSTNLNGSAGFGCCARARISGDSSMLNSRALSDGRGPTGIASNCIT